jgi:hypothetical protein
MCNYGKPKWDLILQSSGITPSTTFFVFQDVDDAKVMEVIGNACKILKLTLHELAVKFGEYWVTVYAPKSYPNFFENTKNAKEFLLKMDIIHELVTRNMKNAKPPHFTYEEKNDKILIINYISHRNLIDVFVGLIYGVGKYFKENLKVNKLSETKVQVNFE